MYTISVCNAKLSALVTLSAFIYVILFVEEDEEEERREVSYAHSPTDLLVLASLEEDLFKIVKEYVAEDEQVQLFFKRYIADYEESSLLVYEKSVAHGNNRHNLIHTNPLLVHRMIRRFVADFPRIKDVLFSEGNLEILGKLGSLTEAQFIWPTQKDLNNSMQNLLVLHNVYNLNITEFAEGNISGVITNASLTAVHCYEIAQFAFLNNKQYTLAMEWLKVADSKKIRSSDHQILDYIDNQLIEELLENITKAHDSTWNADRPHFWNLQYYKNKIDSDYPLITQKSLLQRRYTRKGPGEDYISLYDEAAFSTLCKGGNLQSEKEKSKLYCWYESKIHPAFYINPHKMELYSEDPYIFQVYDFIGNEMINYLKEESIPLMERSKVSTMNEDFIAEHDPSKSVVNYAQLRTSMYSWLFDNVYSKVQLLSEYIGHLTGLDTSFDFNNPTAPLQVAVYATGGYFNIHFDSLEHTLDFQDLIDNNVGDRLATFMLYLNDVELGGHTVFTSVGVGIPPVKGSAIFWYNSKYNGKVDYRMLHGGCPVLLGEKWVGNKWIHQYPNILKRKCTLNKQE